MCATALVAIAVLLLADFDDRTWKIIATTAMMSAASLLAMPGGALLDQGRAVALGWATLAIAAYCLAHALVLVWTEEESGWKLLVAAVAFAAACSQASATTSRRRDDDPQSVRVLHALGVAGGFLTAALVTLAAWQEIEDEGFYRLLGALAVAVLLVTVLQPILRRTGRGGGAARRAFSMTLTTDDGGELRREVEAPDFAGAAAAAIREAERGGPRVVRVERR